MIGLSKETKYTTIGGSALIEGVMMRSAEHTAIAVRRSGGGIVLKVTDNQKPMKVLPKIPLLRGLVAFVQSLKTSYGAMSYAADIAMADAAEETPPETKFEKFLTKLFGKTGMAILSAVALVIGLGLGIVLFLVLPTFAVSSIVKLFPGFETLSESTRRVITSVGEGVIKLAVFFLYLLSISMMKDIKRVFQYHGAEHKTIFCFEQKKELTPENAGSFRRFHPRCGTSFIFLTLLVGIVISTFITVSNPVTRAAVRICFLPLMLGLAYEAIRLAGKYDNLFTRILSAPGLWFQRLTTREPDEKQLEIAIVALKGVLDDYPKDTDLNVAPDGTILPEKEQETDGSDPA